MLKLVECSECSGVGTVEDRKGVETVCNSCRGKGTIYESETSNGRPSSSKEEKEQ